ncbi:hypothetical protein [Plasticicumulans acidivorans]|uniref:Uncharacterized protein n=1 Tax=Plasticicumulans acidivorans TaxID=886464 RepID=A0A317MWR8_9GAMM|nr:hypothetical protein [Plasticicumulans acidivorans]PWV62410.1 hypothetical protein C7443_104205 [Plasticicumulans acidivorans]
MKLDDTLTQSGTVAKLRGDIGYQSIQAIALTVLTGKQYSARLVLLPDTLAKLRNHYATLEPWWNTVFGHGFADLSGSEVRSLLGSQQEADAIRDRILAARQAAGF